MKLPPDFFTGEKIKENDMHEERDTTQLTIIFICLFASMVITLLIASLIK